MTIAEEISALSGRVIVAYDHLSAKGATMPAQKNTYSLSTTIDSITAAQDVMPYVDGTTLVVWPGITANMALIEG